MCRRGGSNANCKNIKNIIIYLSHGTQVVGGTVFTKHTVSYLYPADVRPIAPAGGHEDGAVVGVQQLVSSLQKNIIIFNKTLPKSSCDNVKMYNSYNNYLLNRLGVNESTKNYIFHYLLPFTSILSFII